MNGNGILRAGRLELRVFDLEKSVDYYKNVIGLDVTAQDENRVYFKAWDEFDHHSLILQKSDSAGMDHMAFKVADHAALELLEYKIEQFGCKLSRISNRTRVAEGEAIRFQIPTGHYVELYTDIEHLGIATGSVNPDPWPDGLRGIAPHRLDHALLVGDDVKTTTRFFTEILGFKQSEKILSVDGEQMIGSFLTTTNKAHDIAFIKGPDAKLHHVGFYVDNWYEVLKAADILSKNKVEVEITPTRHGITRGQTVYFFDPSGNRNEAFASGYMTYADFPTITWTEDQIGAGIFYHRRELVESFNLALT
ncbi:catechol 2,3-dioxygenase [Neobacillus drentensis]|uniref:catechol 2,3-dioxygenase n=1 Tax=Neobacillus drentensis TaxID=220684 RepID=UPI0008246379|nr:catechol 2,3-dioxygenase [Neobacillus drentensis]